MSARYAKLPLAFERQGSADHENYIARGSGYAVSLQDGNARIGILAGHDGKAGMVSMKFAGSRKAVSQAGEELPGKVNYMSGTDPRNWRLGLPTYRSVTYRGIYPNVDVVFYGNQQQLEFDLVLQPGADPGNVRLTFDGAQELMLGNDGILLVRTPAGDLRLPLPAIYQEVGKSRRVVSGRYAMRGKNEVGFRVQGYDRTKPLIIDPTIVYAALIGGGTNTSFGTAIAVDSSGNAYITGYTNAADFPTVNAASSQMHAAPDGFVTKIDAGGTSLLYSTYVGGAGSDVFNGIAVDSAGQAWVTGSTTSTDFPAVGAFQSRLNGTQNSVILKLGVSGNLLYSSYFGVSGNISGLGIGLDGAGNPYITGNLTSGSTVPATLNAFQSSPQGGQDAYAAKFNAAGTLAYCTYLGGASDDVGNAIAVDSTGNAYIAGNTNSAAFAGAPAGGAQSSKQGSLDAFVAKLNPAGTGLTYFTFLGGSSDDHAQALAVDAGGNTYVAGYTSSADFPTTASVLQHNYGGGSSDGFVAKLNSAGSAFTYVTYLGGTRGDIVFGVAIDGTGNAFITGRTQSDQFPVVTPIQGSLTGDPTSLFHSTTGGASWSPFDANITGEVINVLPDPATAGVIVAVTDAGISRTVNGGAAWTQTLTVPSPSVSRSLANGNTIYALSSGTSYRSTDGGATWTTGQNFGINAFASIVADPLTANTAYAAYTADKVFKTTDGGATWSQLSSGLTGFFVESFVASPDGSLYLDTNTLVYKSTNQGVAWTSASSGLTSGGVPNGITVANSNQSILYRISAGSVYKSLTAGGSWSKVSGILPAPAQAVAVSPSNSSQVFAAVSVSPGLPSLYVSADGGATWSATSTGLGTASISRIVFDPVSGATMYATAATAQSAFASEINSSASALVYSTYLAGSSFSVGNGIAAGSAGDAFIVGYSSGAFPATTTLWQGDPTSFQAFVARITGTTSACSYSVSPASETIYSSAQAVSFTVLAPSGCAWTASSNQSWATLAAGASGAGSGSGVVDALANTSGLTRTATLTIAGHSFVLTQAPSSCTYTLNASASTVSGAGGVVSVTVTTGPGCPWSVVNNYPTALSVSGGSGTGSGATNITVGPSPAQGSRSLTVPIGSSTITIIQSGSLSVTKTHAGNFTAGQIGATYTITISNDGSVPTSGTITMTEMLPSGLTLVSMAGTGWICNSSSCSRNDSLAGGSSYPTITVTVNVASNATSPQVNAVGVSVGGVTAAGTIDVTTIAPALLNPLQFVPVAPCRVMDTRNANGPFGGPFIGGSSTRAVAIQASPCGIPANAVAYALNFTVVPRTNTLGYLTVWPTGQPQPVVSTLNSPDGSVLANAAIVPAGTGGSINAFATDDTELIIDVNGYFAPPATGTLQFYPLAPCRVLDTRNATGTFGGPALAAATGRSFPVRSSGCGVPPAAAAYSFNLTVVPHGTLGYVTTWPTGQPQPVVSTLNSLDGTVLANAAIVRAGANGDVSFYADQTTDLVVDINGYFAPPASAGLNFFTVPPCRVVDTRNGNSLLGGPILNANSTRTFPLSQGTCGLPSNAAAYSLNMTVVPTGFLGYLTTWPAGASQPVVSTLNAYKGEVVANAAIVPAGVSGAINVYVVNTTHVVIDTNGYFAQ